MNLLKEYLLFLKKYKMWWLLPILILTFLLGIFLIAAASKGGLLIYTLF